MTSRTRTAVSSFLTVTLAIIVAPAFAEIPNGVSPGAVDRIAEIEGRCPTFIWSPIPGAAFHELVGYRLPKDSESADLSAVELSDADQVVFTKVPGAASAWAPELAGCLTPGGEYVWFVRAVYREEDGEVAEASEWSYGRYFSISSMPSAGEVEEALGVLRRYAGHTVDPEGLETERADTNRPAPSRRVAVPQQVPKSVTSAKTAIKGTVSDVAGETYGVVGISNSPNGAGVAAANTNGGPDLVIDGSEDGRPDAVFTQAGIDRASPSEQWFSLINSDTGVLSLNVEGTIVGDGSGLTAVDADTLDGTEGSAFATDVEAEGLVTAHAASADHDGRYFTETELGTSGGSAVNWSNLTNVPAGLDDGDDNTNYFAGTGMTLSDTTFSTQHFAFSAYSSSGSATLASGDVITFDTEHYDDGAVFNTTNNRFTAPVAGVYHFDVHIRFSGAPTANVYMWYALYVSGSLIKDTTGATSTEKWGLTLSADLKLTAGQYVDVRMGSTGSTPNYQGGTMNTWFNGHKVP